MEEFEAEIEMMMVGEIVLVENCMVDVVQHQAIFAPPAFDQANLQYNYLDEDSGYESNS